MNIIYHQVLVLDNYFQNFLGLMLMYKFSFRFFEMLSYARQFYDLSFIFFLFAEVTFFQIQALFLSQYQIFFTH